MLRSYNLVSGTRCPMLPLPVGIQLKLGKATEARTRPPRLASASPAAAESVGAAMCSAASPLPKEIWFAAKHGDLQKVVKWLRKGARRRVS